MAITVVSGGVQPALDPLKGGDLVLSAYTEQAATLANWETSAAGETITDVVAEAFVNGSSAGIIAEEHSAFSPASLFASGEQGAWFDPSDLSTLFQDSAGTTAVTADGDPVGYMGDKSGNGNHATQSTSAARPVYRTDGTLHWLEFDGVDDGLRTANGVLNTSTVTTVCGVNTGGNRGAVWGLPHEANNHTFPYFRFSLFRTDSSRSETRLNGSRHVFSAPIGDNVFYVSSSDTEIRVNGNVETAVFPAAPLTYPNIVPLLIGQNAFGAENLSGKFYGFIGIDRSLTSVEIGEAETYIGARMGVTI